MPFIISESNSHGKNVVIGSGSRIAGIQNISFGDDVYIGPGAVLYSTKANLVIGNHVNFGPNVTVITGDHRMDVIGEYMKCIPEENKLPENDIDVVIGDDVWIGTRAIMAQSQNLWVNATPLPSHDPVSSACWRRRF